MDTKKISFGFSKVTRKSNLLPTKQPIKEDKNVDLIKCLEGQQIKLIEEKASELPLIIPLKQNQKTSTALASLMKRRAVLLGEDDELEVDSVTVTNEAPIADDVNEDLEKRAARELLAELQTNGLTNECSTLVLPIKADELPLDGAKQSTLDDYESIPIQQFGLAMLRGMGWVEVPRKKGGPADEVPIVRPKGMGLGADKALKTKPLLVPPEPNEVLEIKKLAFVRILSGKSKDMYGQIEGFDDYAGRVIVRMAIGGKKEAFNEFLCQPISKKEFAEYGKCINTAKFEKYKKLDNESEKTESKPDKKESNSYVQREDKYSALRLNEQKTQNTSKKFDHKSQSSSRTQTNHKERRIKASAGCTNDEEDRFQSEKCYNKDIKIRGSNRRYKSSDDSSTSLDSELEYRRRKEKLKYKDKSDKSRYDTKQQNRSETHSSKSDYTTSKESWKYKTKTKKNKKERSYS